MINFLVTRNALTFILNYLCRFCCAGIVIYCCWIPIINRTWFSWHVILCTLGLIPFMAESLILFGSDELWSQQLTRKQKYWLHGGLMALGTVLISAGSIVTFVKYTPGYHLYTVHGISGLVAMIMFIVALLQGVGVVNSSKFKDYLSPVTQKFLHNSFGAIGFLVGMISLAYSYYSNWFVFYSSYEARISLLAATVIATLWSLRLAILSGVNQIKTILN